MIKTITTILMIITVIAFSGCKQEKVNDVPYYMSHQKERKEKILECDNNPGIKELTPNCVNARQAEKKKMFTGDKTPTIRL